ncbi:MAG TPA: SBBP repeat-containing protein, partial [Candidatus Binataceae bacterium]|nr:SBBP repeat-containing protein [Candidatus Binataceae bacterium]
SKLNPSASGPASLVYSTYLGGSDGPSARSGAGDGGDGIAVDSRGYAYVTGRAFSFTNASCTGSGTPDLCCSGPGTGTCIGFPTTAGAFQTVNNAPGGYNAFMAELDPSASGSASLVYSTYLGGSGDDGGAGVAVDSAGNAYVTGIADSIPNTNCTGAGHPHPCCSGLQTGSCIGFPTTLGAFQTINNAADNVGSSFNGFVSKLDPQASGASSLIYSTYLGGTAGDEGFGIAVDSSGNAYVTGSADSPDFPITASALQPVNNAPGPPSTNAFVAGLDMIAGATPTTTVTPTATPTATAVPDRLSISPHKVAFGRKQVGSTTEKTAKVAAKKTNKLPVLIENIAVSSTTGDYAIDSLAPNSCIDGEQLEPGQSCSIVIKFAPSAKTMGQTDTGQLAVTTDAETMKPPGGLIPLKGGGR